MVTITHYPHRAKGDDDGVAWDHCCDAGRVLLPTEREKGSARGLMGQINRADPHVTRVILRQMNEHDVLAQSWH